MITITEDVYYGTGMGKSTALRDATMLRPQEVGRGKPTWNPAAEEPDRAVPEVLSLQPVGTNQAGGILDRYENPERILNMCGPAPDKHLDRAKWTSCADAADKWRADPQPSGAMKAKWLPWLAAGVGAYLIWG